MNTFRRLALLGAIAVPHFLFAASSGQTLRVRIPFPFLVAGHEFAAGDYQVQQADNGVVMIQGNSKAIATLSVPGGLPKSGVPSGLQFSSDGQHQVLVGVQVEGESARNLPMHSEEKKIALAGAK